MNKFEEKRQVDLALLRVACDLYEIGKASSVLGLSTASNLLAAEKTIHDALKTYDKLFSDLLSESNTQAQQNSVNVLQGVLAGMKLKE